MAGSNSPKPHTNEVQEPDDVDTQNNASCFDNTIADDLENITDYVEEKEFLSTDELKDAITFIGDYKNKEVATKITKEKELFKVDIKKEHVDLIAQELEIPHSIAERVLREHRGNLETALIALTE